MATLPFSLADAQFAIEAVREAALLARRIQREMVTGALTKDDRSPVTVADFAVQALIAHRLADYAPKATLIGEEQADALRGSENASTLDQITKFVQAVVPRVTASDVCSLIDRGSGTPPSTFWTLDPIDGTKGFLRREQYAVALALVHNGQVELGVLGCPELSLLIEISHGSQPTTEAGGSLAAAVRGEGSWSQPLDESTPWRRLSVSARKEPSEARILRSVEKAHTNVDEIGQLAANLGTAEPPMGMDSQAKYAVLAAGEGDVMLRLLSPSRPDYREKIWDQAAGSIVVEEAGGRITDLDGKSLDFSHGRTLAKNRGVLATNGRLHEAVLAALRQLGA